MGVFSRRNRDQQPPVRRFPLLWFLALAYAGVRVLGHPSLTNFIHARLLARSPPLPIISPADFATEPAPPEYVFHFPGARLRGNGVFLDLGDRRTHLPASLLALLFPEELIVPSCLTEPPPASPPTHAADKPLPIRDDWPGFYGAPWTARVNGDLLALLNVSAPRNAALPVPPPEFQLYPDYAGGQTTPAFSTPAKAIFIRGGKAVLYRVFLTGPVRCLDLVVQNGENSGAGHLYYQKYHHYYVMDTIFRIQQ